MTARLSSETATEDPVNVRLLGRWKQQLEKFLFPVITIYIVLAL